MNPLDLTNALVAGAFSGITAQFGSFLLLVSCIRNPFTVVLD